MKYPPIILLGALLFAPILPSSLAQDLPAPNAATLLKQLNQASLEMRNTSQARRASALSQIQTALSGGSPVDFYLQALDNTRYRDNHQGLVDWRRRSDDFLHGSALQSAAQLQLRYLTISLQRSKDRDAFAQVPDVLTYLGLLAARNARASTDKPVPEAENLIRQPLQGASITEWLQIGDLLPNADDFANSPGDYQQILEKNVRTPLRAKSDPRLPSTWDMQIAVEVAQATASNSKQQIENFNQKQLPSLLFSKAQDTAAIGQPNRAISEIMMLIQKYPACTDAKNWIETARKLLEKSSPTTAPTPASTETPFPAPKVIPVNQ